VPGGDRLPFTVLPLYKNSQTKAVALIGKITFLTADNLRPEQ
jgi:hypothetical protein